MRWITATPRDDGRLGFELTVPGTTGHMWEVEGVTDATVAEDPPATVVRERGAPIGGPFTVRFVAQALGDVDGSLLLVLRRPWDPKGDVDDAVRVLVPAVRNASG